MSKLNRWTLISTNYIHTFGVVLALTCYVVVAGAVKIEQLGRVGNKGPLEDKLSGHRSVTSGALAPNAKVRSLFLAHEDPPKYRYGTGVPSCEGWSAM
jgi:hypothetical protein